MQGSSQGPGLERYGLDSFKVFSGKKEIIEGYKKRIDSADYTDTKFLQLRREDFRNIRIQEWK
ncbi:MAG: hypothetical protein GX175_06360 [Halanaerobiaceae bacterium]|jgi:hypothetical protein|nr:hypothetical protein [Halanaerobiaceae bacterium]